MAKIFTDEMLDFIKDVVKGRNAVEITNLVNERFKTQFTVGQIQRCKCNHGFTSDLNGSTYFRAGHRPWNKGLKMSDEVKRKIAESKTMFAVGHVPHQTLPLGTERKDKDGYIEVKVKFSEYSTAGNRGKCSTFDTVWIGKQKKVWIDHYGDNIPPRSKIIFLDKNKYNFDINNLACVSNSHHAVMCRKGRYTEFKEVTEAGKLLTELEQTIKNKT